MIKLRNKHPKIFFLILFLAIFFSIGYSQIDLIKAYARSNATLVFTTKNVTIEPGEKYSIPIKLNTMAQKVIGTDVVITYNQNVIKILGVASLDTFDNPVISKIDNKKGIATFHLINNEEHYISINDNIFVITIVGEDTGNTSLSIKTRPKKDENGNVNVSHVTLNDKSDGLGNVNKVLVRVKLSPNSREKDNAYGITEKGPATSGIQPLQNSKVLGASDIKKETFFTKGLRIIKTPFAIGVSIASLVFIMIGFKIYKAYKKSLDEAINDISKK